MASSMVPISKLLRTVIWRTAASRYWRVFSSSFVSEGQASAHIRLNQPMLLLIAVEKRAARSRRRSSQGAQAAKIEDEIALPARPSSSKRDVTPPMP